MRMKNGHGGKIHALAAELKVDPKRILDFSASINPLGPPEGMTRALGSGLESLILHYPPAGAEYLQEELADHLGLAPESLLVGNGSTELIHLLPRLESLPRALIIEPAFSEYRAGLAACGWEVEPFLCREEAGFVPDEADRVGLLKKAEEGFGLIFLGRPANPSGTLTDPGLVLDLARAQEGRGLLAVDEAFIDFRPGESLLSHIADHPGLAVLGSLTKFYAMPGLRLGWLAAAPSAAERLRRLQPPWSVNILAQEAGRYCLAHHKEYAVQTRSLIEQARADLAADLARLGLAVLPSTANYLLVRLARAHPSAAELARRLRQELILIRDCSNYQGLSDRFFRVSVRLPEENRRLIAALERSL